MVNDRVENDMFGKKWYHRSLYLDRTKRGCTTCSLRGTMDQGVGTH